MTKLLAYYSRKDIQKAIVNISKDREVAVKYKEKFGKRPDILQFENDILELAKEGATSFHISEERWKNPLRLEAGMIRKNLDELRSGWDLILDVDCKFIEYSKACAQILIEALNFHNIENISVKFSGNAGFHIGLPFESFPDKVNKIDTNLLFPEGPRKIANYLKNFIKEPLSEEILKLNTLKEISRALKIHESKLKEKDKFNPFSVLDIDTVLISNRHMFRAPYSLNEKRGLVSLPIKANEIKNFKLRWARIENVEVENKFLNFRAEKKEASQLIMQAFDWSSKSITNEIKINKNYEIPKIAIKEEFFPPCIKLLVNGIKQDGRKRAIFILTNFLRQIGLSVEDLDKFFMKWNDQNYEPLGKGYILSQINWHKKQKQNILPPNCANESYYKSLDVCKPDNLCKSIKNPVNYAVRKSKFKNK